MSENKLVDKTRKVLEKQEELSGLIDDLKSEVKDVYYENRKLSEENLKLKEELALFRRGEAPRVKPVEEVKVEPVGKVKVEPVKEVVKPDAVEPKLEVQEQEEVHQPRIIVKKHERRPNAIIEFFLGKNIIAKIAAVLIFLGIITFGQMAYDWLPEIGKFLLILFTGILFFGLGAYAEKKKAIVFSNVFYTIGLAIIYYSFMLARFPFKLYSISVLSYILLALMAFAVYYFRKKRYEFLDVALFIFYFVVGLSFVYYVKPVDFFSYYIEAVLFVGILGYIIYEYYTNYIKDNEKLRIITQFLLVLAFFVYMVSIPRFFDYDSTLQGVIILLYSTLGVFAIYLINYMNKPNGVSRTRFVVPIVSSLVLLIMAMCYYFFMTSMFDLENMSILVFFYIILFAPLYTYLYIKKRAEYPYITDYYVLVLALAMLIFSFAAGAFNLERAFDFYLLNIILAAEILVFYVLTKFTKDKLQRYISYTFIAILLLRNQAYYLNEGSMLFSDSKVLFVTIGLGLLLFGVNTYFRYARKEEHQIDNVVVNGFNVIALVPFMIIFTNDLLSTDKAYIMAMVMLLLIGYRWLMELDVFRMFYKKHFVLGMNVSILLLTFLLNQFYFDHDFSKFEDVFKFLFLFVVNIYTVYSLKEIFVGYAKTIYVERNFIFLYGIGVAIHSFFIYNYINFEFDKVILSSYFLIASAVGVLAGFRQGWSTTRKIGLGAIYYSLLKFFIYDFYTQDFSNFVRMMTYFILGFILLGISFLYAYLEKVYGSEEIE